MKIIIICAVALALGILDAAAQDTNAVQKAERLDAIAKSYTTDNAFMGTVLVADGDRPLLDKGYGMADLEWSLPNTPDVKFRLGSLTKQFTATLVLLLQQDGKLHIEDPVHKYLPDTPKSWERITIANLLGHTSGIPNFIEDKAFATWSMSAHTHEEEIAFFRDKPLAFAPGSQYAYSNSNYEVLGTIIEKVSGRSYGDLLKERIFQPLEMVNSGLDTDELILPKRAQGYQPGETGLVHACSESMTVPWAAGSIYSTTGDLLRWERGLFGGKVLNEASLKAMTTAGKGNYGLGLQVTTRNGVQVIKHAGGIEGFNTQLTCAPKQRLVVVVVSNVNGATPEAMGEQLLDVAMGKPVILASERKPVPIAKEELAKFAWTYEIEPGFVLTIAVSVDSLTLQGTGGPLRSLMYQGTVGGHPRFFAPKANAEIEFVPDAAGTITSLILHRGGDIPAKKR
ncbi:MAG: serine hydrolase [Verrucomicrobiota bacterium]|nr:serine hydrolase [Verrucomicrobiota bacterium]